MNQHTFLLFFASHKPALLFLLGFFVALLFFFLFWRRHKKQTPPLATPLFVPKSSLVSTIRGLLSDTQKRFDLEAGGYIKEAGIDIYNQNGELDRFMSFNSNLDFDMELIYNGSRYSFSLNDPRDYLTNQVSGRIVWLEKILIQ